MLAYLDTWIFISSSLHTNGMHSVNSLQQRVRYMLMHHTCARVRYGFVCLVCSVSLSHASALCAPRITSHRKLQTWEHAQTRRGGLELILLHDIRHNAPCHTIISDAILALYQRAHGAGEQHLCVGSLGLANGVGAVFRHQNGVLAIASHKFERHARVLLYLHVASRAGGAWSEVLLSMVHTSAGQ